MLLTLMAGSFALTMRRETAIISVIKNRAQIQALAEAGIAVAELMLLSNDPEVRWQTDGRIYELSYAGATIRLRLLAEAGKIDINAANAQRLQALVGYGGIADSMQQRQLVDAILDWRDQDDDVRFDGAEKNQYSAAGLNYGPANRAFQSTDELLLVLGMDDWLFNRLEPLITSYANKQVDLQKASKEVLEVLHAESQAVSTESAAPESSSSLPNHPFAMAAASAQASSDSPSAADAVTIIAEAMGLSKISARVKVVVAKSTTGSQPFRMLQWRADDARQQSLFDADMNGLLDTDYARSQLDH